MHTICLITTGQALLFIFATRTLTKTLFLILRGYKRSCFLYIISSSQFYYLHYNMLQDKHKPLAE